MTPPTPAAVFFRCGYNERPTVDCTRSAPDWLEPESRSGTAEFMGHSQCKSLCATPTFTRAIWPMLWRN